MIPRAENKFRMKLKSFVMPTVAAVSVLWISAWSSAQDNAAEKRISQLESRLDSIEERLGRIENVLFATIRYSEAEARRQLDIARETVAQSEKLHAQGLITATQLTLDRMSMNRAATLHKMCIQNEDHRRIGATLNVLDAKILLERRQLELVNSEKLFRKGFIAKTRLVEDRDAVILAGQNLKLAQTKLKEIEAALPSKKKNSNEKNPKAAKIKQPEKKQLEKK